MKKKLFIFVIEKIFFLITIFFKLKNKIKKLHTCSLTGSKLVWGAKIAT